MPDFKALLDTPRKVRTAVLCGLVALATLIAVFIYAAYALGFFPAGDAPPGESGAPSSTPGSSQAPESDAPSQSCLAGLVPAMTIDEAKQLALADAGLAEEEAEFVREALEEDNGIWVYSFRFRAQGVQYAYKLNANTGGVREKIKESLASPSTEAVQQPSAPPSVPPSQPAVPDSPPPAQTQAPEDVGLEGAKSAALADAEAPAGQAVFTKAERDREDGRLVYDIEFHTSAYEYEYEIDAATGAVLSRSRETLPSPPGTGSSYIGVKRARAIALDHAGLAASEVAVTRTAMDREDGRMVYEIEFRRDAVEYEYKIDALSGSILEAEQEER